MGGIERGERRREEAREPGRETEENREGALGQASEGGNEEECKGFEPAREVFRLPGVRVIACAGLLGFWEGSRFDAACKNGDFMWLSLRLGKG